MPLVETPDEDYYYIEYGPNLTEFPNIEGSPIVGTFENKATPENRASRYRTQDRLLNDDDEEYIETYDGIEVPKSKVDSFHIVKKTEENRIDLISWQYYKTPLLYWVIAEASDLRNPFELPEGTVLRIPDRQTLFGARKIII